MRTSSLKQFVLSPAAGKRLIAKSLVAHPAIQAALKSGTFAIIAGTTNGYVAEEILVSIGQPMASHEGGSFVGLPFRLGGPPLRLECSRTRAVFPAMW